MRDSSIFYRSFYEAISELPEVNQLEVYKAVFEYTFNFKENELKGLSKTIFTLIKPQLDANNKKFTNGKNGGRPPKYKQDETKEEPKNNQNETKSKANVNVNVNVNDNVTVNVNDTDNDILLEKETKEILSDFFPEDQIETSTSVNPETEKEKKVAPKKEKEQPPDLDTFVQLAREIYQNDLKLDFSRYEFAVRSKFTTWKDAGWRDGNNKPILAWKNKLRNTIPHLKPIYGNSNTGQSNSNGNGNTGGGYQAYQGGKTSFNQILARKLNAAGNSESGNITIDAEVVE